MSRSLRVVVVAWLLTSALLHAQAVPAEDSDQRNNTLVGAFTKRLLFDQKTIWTAPARVRGDDLLWIAPLAGVTAGLLATDSHNMRNLSLSSRRLSLSHDVANGGVAAMMGGAGAFYLMGVMTNNDHARETGLLSAEAAVNGVIVDSALKYATRRDRPLEGDGTGAFRSNGLSFASEHSAVAWSIATVFAHEYPGIATQALAYGAATAISVSRVTSKDHFPSDVLVGSTLGYLIGRQVYRAHHDTQLPGAEWGTFSGTPGEARRPQDMASPYVPLDSWVYPAFDRLAAMGYVQSGFAGMRPWTRLECVRLLDEAAPEFSADDAAPANAETLYRALRDEFAADEALAASGRNRTARVESLYARVTNIAGDPLTDGYHFAQTEINDFGRPYAEGNNVISGFSASASAGPAAVYVRGEYQHAPSAPALPLAARQGIADFLPGYEPLMPGTASPQVDRFHLLDTYFALTHANWQFSFGKQSLWMGPSAGGPLSFSDNADPVYMARLSRVSPFKLPGIFGLLGPVRTDFFLGRLAGQHFVNLGSAPAVGDWETSLDDQPFITGQKISFRPTPNLEFGVSRTGIFGGPDFPVTFGRFRHVLLSSGNGWAANDPGDRRSGFDFSYRIPKLRKYLVLYNDSMAEDEMSPIGYPRRSAMNPGIYIPQFPGLRKLDLRAEGVYTDLPGLVPAGFYYYNVRYIDGYTNRGDLMGSWVGREGRGIQLWSTYWYSPRTTFQVGFRKQGVNPEFLSGGTLHDYSARGTFMLRPDLQLRTVVQYEDWNFPLLSSGVKSNLSSTVELTFWPAWRR